MAGVMARFTMANSAGLYPPMKAANGTRKRRRKAAKVTRGKAKRRAVSAKRARSGRPARLVKGSAAARRYMAKIRKMRKR